MGNCLVKRLKATVSNPDLPIFGEGIILHVVKADSINDASRQQGVALKGNKAFTIKALGNGYFSTTVEGLETNRLTQLNIEANTLTTIYVANLDFNITATNLNDLLSIALFSASGKTSIIHVNLAELEDCILMTSLSLKYSNSVGDLSDIGGLTNLTGGDALTMISTSITGTIESFVSGQVDAGATSRTDTSFGGSKLLNGHTTFGIMTSQPANPCILQWNGKNKIILFIGNGLSIESCTAVYAKGATAEEIAAWQEGGKTVTDVDTGTVYPPTN